jgi:hypothetical protein
MTQTRGNEASGQDKYRVTFEICQEIFHYFDEDKDPVGKIGTSALILIGSHARLSNITNEGKIIHDEAFVVDGKEVFRKAGTSARGLLKAWVDLRNQSAEVREWLKEIEVYQQPAGFMDSIIYRWRTEAQMLHWPQAVHVRDLFAAALTDNARKIGVLAHQVPAWIGGKMTAALQVTDTDLARPLKVAANKAKELIRKELREKANLEGVKHVFKCGPFEVLRIAHAGHQHMKEINAQGDIVLKACRRNHFLAYRPSLSQGKLVKAGEQKWAMEMPEGQHRIMASWAEGRYQWLNDAGVPKAPDWSFKTGANVKSIEDMEDATCLAEEGSKIMRSSWL